MPTYDYACKKCGHTFEHFQALSDKLLRTCPECKQRSLERLFGTGIGVVFKGSGFYETDYKRAGTSKGGRSGDGGKQPPSDGGSEKRDGGGGKAGEKDSGASTDKGKDSSKATSGGSGEGSGVNKGPGKDKGPGQGGSSSSGQGRSRDS